MICKYKIYYNSLEHPVESKNVYINDYMFSRSFGFISTRSYPRYVDDSIFKLVSIDKIDNDYFTITIDIYEDQCTEESKYFGKSSRCSSTAELIIRSYLLFGTLFKFL